MKVAFYTNQMCERGSEIALFDYATHNRTLLGNDSLILYDATHPWNMEAVVQRFKAKFTVFGVAEFDEVDRILKDTAVCIDKKMT